MKNQKYKKKLNLKVFNSLNSFLLKKTNIKNSIVNISNNLNIPIAVWYLISLIKLKKRIEKQMVYFLLLLLIFSIILKVCRKHYLF